MIDDHEVFGGGDYADRDTGAVGGDGGFAADVVARRVDDDAESFQIGADFGAGEFAVLEKLKI